MSGWRMVTMCQLEARLVSELRHRQLHSAISVQAKLIKMYQGLLRSKFLSDNTLEIGNSNWNHYHRVELPQEPFDTEFYNACTRTFNAIYAQTDEIFNSCGLNSTDEMFGSYTCEKKDENDRSFFQFTDKRTFSSSFENAHNSFRRTLSLHQKKHQQQYGGMEDPDNTVAIKFRVTARLKTGFVGSVLLRLIHRRYQEVNRMVTVWRVFAEGEGEFAALHAAEIGWGILSPVPGVPESTMLRVCAHYIPMNLNNVVAPEQEQLTKQFSGMVVEASTSNAEEIACTFEKLLLNDAEEP
ncbi:hypothetical protein PHMEG_00015119 [Phytophthora megakarya]|uniref:Uncharacterized protein n=1 Tax=Phytophthora megakarya TaxID=4795 RepID=A0A225W3P4_9STRA|nr:hypothetical protein PHMEG_00015119 [Phytophthora megakarya]